MFIQILCFELNFYILTDSEFFLFTYRVFTLYLMSWDPSRYPFTKKKKKMIFYSTHHTYRNGHQGQSTAKNPNHGDMMPPFPDQWWAVKACFFASNSAPKKGN